MAYFSIGRELTVPIHHCTWALRLRSLRREEEVHVEAAGGGKAGPDARPALERPRPRLEVSGSIHRDRAASGLHWRDL
jgi:hypothetical protein